MGIPLAEFLERVHIRPATVARKTGLHISTITRLRDGQTPDGATMLRINRWADEVADTLELRPSERLSWEHLLHSGDAA